MDCSSLLFIDAYELCGGGLTCDHTDDTLDLESHHQDDRDREP